MSRYPLRAGWAMVLTGFLGSPASADCRGIEVATYHPITDGRLHLIETRCESGARAFLPWIDTGIEPSVESVLDRAPRESERSVAPRGETLDEVRVVPEKASPQ